MGPRDQSQVISYADWGLSAAWLNSFQFPSHKTVLSACIQPTSIVNTKTIPIAQHAEIYEWYNDFFLLKKQTEFVIIVKINYLCMKLL